MAAGTVAALAVGAPDAAAAARGKRPVLPPRATATAAEVPRSDGFGANDIVV